MQMLANRAFQGSFKGFPLRVPLKGFLKGLGFKAYRIRSQLWAELRFAIAWKVREAPCQEAEARHVAVALHKIPSI